MELKILSGLLLLCGVSFGQDVLIQRIDGSTTTSHAIDSTIIQLMNAAKVTGLEIAIINNHKINTWTSPCRNIRDTQISPETIVGNSSRPCA
jgi:hypothetical protein